MNDSVIALITLVIMLAGLAGIFLPVVPGLVLVWIGAVFYGLFAGFGSTGAIAFMVITALAIAGITLGYFLPGHAAGQTGATTTSIVIGVICAIIGFFVIPIFGLPIGGIIGIFLGELNRTNDMRQARQATWATLIGFGLGMLSQLLTGLLMVVAWLVWALT